MKTLIALAGSIILGTLAVGSPAAAPRSASSSAATTTRVSVSSRAGSQESFVGPTEYATGGSPWAVWVADLNGDARRDVLTLDGSNTGSVLLGTGDGRFERKRTFHTGSWDIADVGDLNGDGKLDLVIASSDEEEEPTVAVLLNRGDGSFAARRAYRTAGPVQWFAIDDVNGDGKPDLVTANALAGVDEDEDEDEEAAVQGSVSVLLNKGDGFFQPRRDYELEHQPNEAELDDLNRDGMPELVIANDDDDSISVLLNRGGGFGTGRDYETGNDPITLAVRDLNGDGKPDLMTLNYYGEEDSGGGSVSVLLNHGDGSFGPRRDYETGELPNSLAVGDLNGDRRADLVTANWDARTVSILINKGDGTFRTKHDYPAGDEPALLAISDLNGDGSPDLVTLADDQNADRVSVLVNNGDGGFPVRRDLETGRGPRDLAIGDLNGDGRRDLVIADGGQLAVSVLLNTMGDGGPFVAPSPLFPHATEYETGRGTVSEAVGDLNGDGRQDLVATNGGSGTVSVLVGRKNGFAPKHEYRVGRLPSWVAIGDLNGDGAPDLAVVNARDDTVSVLLNRGDGSFKEARNYPSGHRPYVVAVGDFDGGGTQDLAIGDAGPIGGLTVSVLLNTGDGTFVNRRAYRTPRAPLSVAVGDLNGDGLPDLVTGNHLRRSVSVLLNAGHGTFEHRRDYRVGRFPRSVAIGDLNGDGAPDLAVANTRDANVSVLLNAGDGRFGEKREYATGTFPSSVVIGDFDGDGAADLATGDLDGWTVCVLPSNADGSFRDPFEYPVPGVPQFLATGDLDGDGRPDLIATLGSSVAVHLNRAAGGSAAAQGP
jgi:hypothetical protein